MNRGISASRHSEARHASVGQGTTALVNLYRTRFELFLLDLEEEKERLEQRLLLSGVAAFLGTLTSLLITAFLITLLWPIMGVWAIGLFAVLYASGAAAAVVALRRCNRERHPTFACTLKEFEKDAERFAKILHDQHHH